MCVDASWIMGRVLVMVLAVVFAAQVSSAQCERQRVQADVPAPLDFFGHSVAISGEYCAVGHSADDSVALNAGAVYIYHRLGSGQWQQVQKFTPDDAQAGDVFGRHVEMHGDALVVSAER